MAPRRKACATCTLAKTKCIWEDETKCERCLRLNKVCAEEMDERVLARKTRAKSTKRVKKLKSTRQNGITAIPELCSSSNSQSASPAINGNDHEIAGRDKQEIWLSLYKTQMTQHFPFVIVPAHISATELESESPLLFNAIMMAACNEPKEQIFRAAKLRQDVARETIVNGVRSVDVLQAILVACGYYHVHLDVGRQLTNLLAIGTAILSDLQLHVSTERPDRRKTNWVTEHCPAVWDIPKQRTLEDRRIFLGFCYVTQFLFITFRRIECFKNTNYLDECCQVLETSRQYETDSYLTYLARLTRQAQMITVSVDMEDLSATYRPSAHDMSFLNWLRDEYQNFRHTELKNGNLETLQALAHMKLIELYLEEIASMFHEGVATGPIGLTSLDSSRRCYHVAKELLSLSPRLMSGPPSNWTHIEMWHNTHAIVVLLKTAPTLIHEGKDAEVRNTTIELLQEAERIFVQGAEDNKSAVSGEHNIYLLAARPLREIREQFAAQEALRIKSQRQSIPGGFENTSHEPAADVFSPMWLEQLSSFVMQRSTWHNL